MFELEALPEPADADVTAPEPTRWPGVLIAAGVLASLLWVAMLGWWLMSAVAAMI
jgi:hypothetical protein